MSHRDILPISKWRCGSCKRDEPLTLNHVYVVAHGSAEVIVGRGLNMPHAPDGKERLCIYCCSIECALKEVAKWAGRVEPQSLKDTKGTEVKA